MDQKQEKQLSFAFCSGCGGYLNPADAAAIVRSGELVVLCKDCRGPAVDTGGMDKTDRLALEFAKKYNLPPEK